MLYISLNSTYLLLVLKHFVKNKQKTLFIKASTSLSDSKLETDKSQEQHRHGIVAATYYTFQFRIGISFFSLSPKHLWGSQPAVLLDMYYNLMVRRGSLFAFWASWFICNRWNNGIHRARLYAPTKGSVFIYYCIGNNKNDISKRRPTKIGRQMLHWNQFEYRTSSKFERLIG